MTKIKKDSMPTYQAEKALTFSLRQTADQCSCFLPFSRLRAFRIV